MRRSTIGREANVLKEQTHRRNARATLLSKKKKNGDSAEKPSLFLFYITNNNNPTVANGTVKLSVPFIETASIIVTITEIIAALKYQYGTFT